MNALLLAAQLDDVLQRPIMAVGLAIMHGDAARPRVCVREFADIWMPFMREWR